LSRTAPYRPEHVSAGLGPRRVRSGNFALYSWFFLRVSGVLLLFLVFGHVLITHIINDITTVNYAFVAERWASPFWRTYDWLMLVLALAHGMFGLRIVIDDYIHRPSSRIIAIVGLLCFGLIFLIAGSVVILTFDPVP
jgi:succinate dehydrogenase / fumarate reductase membrane anchor subunit